MERFNGGPDKSYSRAAGCPCLLYNISLFVHQPNRTTMPKLKTNTLEFLCRTCLKDCGTHFDIFNRKRNNILLADMLASCASLEIRKADGFPINICSDCTEKLTSAFDFKTMVIASNTELHELCRCEGIKRELYDTDMESLIKTEQTTVTDLRCKTNEDTLGNQAIKEEPHVKAELEFVSLEESCGFLNDLVETVSSLEDPFKAEKYEKVRQPVLVADLCGENKDALVNEAMDVTARSEFRSFRDKNVPDDSTEAFIKTEQTTITGLRCKNEDNRENRTTVEGMEVKVEFDSLEEYDGFLSDSTKISSSSGYPSEAEKSRTVPVIDLHYENKDALGNQESEIGSDENDGVSDDCAGASLSLGPSKTGKSPKRKRTTPAAKQKKKQGHDDQKHAELLDNPDYKRIISSGLTRKQRMRETIFCGECNKTYSYKRYITNHVYIHTGTLPYKCDKCEKRYPKEYLLRAHLRSHFQTRDFACDVCGNVFFKKHHLKNHKVEQHSEKRPYKCNVCDKTFKRSWHVTQHAVSHVNDKKFLCDLCGEVHMKKSNHPKDGDGCENNFVCGTCGKDCANKRCLSYHLKTHLGEKPHICNYCGKTFLDDGSLNVHTLTHTGDKPFGCKICGQAFNYSSILERHMRVHNVHIGDIPHSCKLCPSSFRDTFDLAQHMKVHEEGADAK